MNNANETTDAFSPLELLALTSACELDPEAQIACDQLTKASVARREKTGCGLFTHFTTESMLLLTSAEGRILRGSQRISLTHPHLADGADVIVWVENGKMNCLELVTFGAENFPAKGEFRIQHWPEDSESS